jgi:predicted transcriptional regulator of viral defense system
MNKKPDYNELYNIAENQGGYFKASQARELGFSWDRLSKNVKSGKILRVAHGIYRLTQFPYSPREDLFIAWLRAGQKSVISHESALSVYELSDALPHKIHVVVPRSSSRRRKGIRQHTNQLTEEEITTRDGLPITTPARTIHDVAANGLPEELVIQAIDDALAKGLITEKTLEIQTEKYGGRFRKLYKKYMKSDKRK